MKNSLIIVSFITIAWYNVAELTVLIQVFFKRHSGWYYWALMVATYGIFIHDLGTFFKFYHITNIDILDTILAWSGWVMMVTGQSLVLYSRLHLVVHASWKRWVLVMIIVDGILMHISTGVLTFLTNVSSDPTRWKGPYSVVERIQVTVFFIQEVILSAIYIWRTSGMLRSEGPLFIAHENARGARGRKVLLHTIGINIFIICLEITLIALEFSGLYDIQTSYKGAVYSVKLKLEFSILNQLMNLVKGRLAGTSTTQSKSYANTRPTNRSHLRTGLRDNEEGLPAGAYSRMEDSVAITVTPANEIKLQDLKADAVLKTTTTEVRFEVADNDSVDSGIRGKDLRRSSSENSIIHH
ncbi:uncharacterized protein EI97DRAFT_379595 [Westerdykella ornata]|uniref:DUF7703 domain-containing protein n=1 Tax=Westerdykella ornata TaxID=318751 RepID=A0A6A6JG29_WESOR|nr:uncharacterized protein EI97DRAFT_379595 [Westerdykella ornata]KAF2275501.1 hypothetical protein EI97DRAFT_379595 [Westerdykella ornata]